MISGLVLVLVDLMAHIPSQLWRLDVSSRYQESCPPACGSVSLMSLPESELARSSIYLFM